MFLSSLRSAENTLFNEQYLKSVSPRELHNLNVTVLWLEVFKNAQKLCDVFSNQIREVAESQYIASLRHWWSILTSLPKVIWEEGCVEAVSHTGRGCGQHA